MAPDQDHLIQQAQDLPRVLVFHEQTIFDDLQRFYSHKFHFILLPSSDTTLDQFLNAHNYDSSSICVVVCSYVLVTTDVLRHLPSLSLLVTPSAGTNHIDLLECRRWGIKVANVGTVLSEDVADVAVGMLIDLMRKISAGDRFMKGHRNSLAAPCHFPPGSKLRGKRVGIVGLGSIGKETAKRLEAFGCIISYTSKNKKPLVSYPFYESILELASVSEALILCCALNKETKHMVNREVTMAMGKEGIIVNVGRGSLIDEKELVKCLVEREIGGAGLDVFENEPHVPKELFELDNVVLSPHAAVHTNESMMATSELMAANLEAFFSNKPLLTPVIL
ncbi:hypothetical protein K1719_016002 [Acacia pycnantha]|nr:hypothetical protein K1719_016002 [Acacia pycnantha]